MRPDPAARPGKAPRDLAGAAARAGEGQPRHAGIPRRKGKTFAWFTHDHHGIGITPAIVKVSGLDEHELLVGLDPELYYRPAYFRVDSWIGIRTDTPRSDCGHIADRIEASWRTIAPERLREAVDGPL